MYPWKAREAHVFVPGETRQWCLDNGEGDLIPCGSGDVGKERAQEIAETLNSGMVEKLRGARANAVMGTATAFERKTHEFERLLRASIPVGASSSNPKVEALYAKFVEMQNDVLELMKALVTVK